MTVATSQIRKVYKYDLPMTNNPSDIVPIQLPLGAKILKVDDQSIDPMRGPQLFLWALVDPQEPLRETRHVITAGTGHEIALESLSSQGWERQDTIICLGGRMVVHVWVSWPVNKNYAEVSTDAV